MGRVNFLDTVRTIKTLGESISSKKATVYDYTINEYRIKVYKFKGYHDVYLYKDNELIVKIDEAHYYSVADFEDKVNDSFRSGGTITDVIDAYVEEKEIAERLKAEREKEEQEKIEVLKGFMK